MEDIGQNHNILIVIAFIAILIECRCKAQSPNSSSTTIARELDAVLQNNAYQAFDHPMTGTIYDSNVPLNLTGIKIAVLRLRSGSLRFRGVQSYKEFQIPTGVVVQPYVKRLAFVYQNLGNWSSFYYPLPGFTYLSPVLGLLAYNAANVSATDLNELDVVASKSPILIKFMKVSPVPNGSIAKCVWFDLDGLPEFRDMVLDNICSTYRQGHFSIVVNTTALAPSPSPSPCPGPGGKKIRKSEVWKIVVGVVCGFVSLVLLALICVCISRCRKNKKLVEMEKTAELGESLQMARVGVTQAPVALGTRTPPVLENEYVA